MLNKNDRRGNLKIRVYEEIKNAITKHYYPGMKLDERELSNMLDVSRTPVREAFVRLEQEGLVYNEPNRGVFISRITFSDLIEILDMREGLESVATRLFAQRAREEEVSSLERIMSPFTEENLEDRIEDYNYANVDFHHYIIEHCGNRRIKRAIENIYDHILIAKKLQIIPKTKRGIKSLLQHYAIINAIKGKDFQTAEDAMKDHIRSLRADIMENRDSINHEPDFFSVES